jgi:hypothetical protein
MRFYARYYIHEMLLVFFVFLAIASGWRYSQSGKKGWAYLWGIGAGAGVCDEGDVGAEFGGDGIGLGLALLWTQDGGLRRR